MLDFTPFQRACAFVRKELAKGSRPGHEVIRAAEQAGYGHALVLLAARAVATAGEYDGQLTWRLKREPVRARPRNGRARSGSS